MRQRYDKLIGPDGYSPDKVSIQSTNEDRCLMSAQTHAAGLFPPVQDHEIWNERIEWQPIPIHTVRDQGNCWKVIRISDEYTESAEIKALLLKHRKLCKFLEVNSGNRVRSVENFVSLYDVLNVEYSNGYRQVFFCIDLCGQK